MKNIIVKGAKVLLGWELVRCSHKEARDSLIARSCVSVHMCFSLLTTWCETLFAAAQGPFCSAEPVGHRNQASHKTHEKVESANQAVLHASKCPVCVPLPLMKGRYLI